MEKTTGKYYFVIALLIVSGALSLVLRYVRVQPDRASDFSVIPMESGGWIGKELPLSDFTLEVLKATNIMSRSYTDSRQRRVSFFVGYFEDQKYGSQIHSPRHCLPGGGWGVLDLRPIEIEIKGNGYTVNRAVIGDKKFRQVVYYWFMTRSGVLTDEYALKFDLVINSLRFRPTDAALIRLITNVRGGDEAAADATLKDFLLTFHDPLGKSLPF